MHSCFEVPKKASVHHHHTKLHCFGFPRVVARHFFITTEFGVERSCLFSVAAIGSRRVRLPFAWFADSHKIVVRLRRSRTTHRSSESGILSCDVGKKNGLWTDKMSCAPKFDRFDQFRVTYKHKSIQRCTIEVAGTNAIFGIKNFPPRVYD